MESNLVIGQVLFGQQSVTELFRKRKWLPNCVYIPANENVLLWLGDPLPGVPKQLTVHYRWFGHRLVRTVSENGGKLVQPLIVGDIDELQKHNPTASLGSGFNNISHLTRIVQGGSGIEIGGPSSVFNSLYTSCQALDNLLFSRNNVWYKPTAVYQPAGKMLGKQLFGEASDTKLDNALYSYILASHSFEHLANPLAALNEWSRICKPGGYMVVIVPWKHRTFDHRRPYTAYEHLQQDYANKVDERDLTHLEEICSLHDIGMDPPAKNAAFFRQRSLLNFENRCLHHHVFSFPLLMQLAQHAQLQVVDIDICDPFHMLIVYRLSKSNV